MIYPNRGNSGRLLTFLKWAAIAGALVFAYAAEALLTIGVGLATVHMVWQVMKGSPPDRAALMPAGIGGALWGVDSAISGSFGSNILDIAMGVVIYAIGAILLLWLLVWCIQIWYKQF